MDDEEAKKNEQEAQEKLEDEIFDTEDEFFKEYRAKLLYQMQQRLLHAYVFSIGYIQTSSNGIHNTLFSAPVLVNKSI